MASPTAPGIEPKDILNWCFTVGAMVFGVFGFLYSVYATGMFQVTPERPMPPPITIYLRRFCRVIATILVVMTVMAGTTAFRATVGWETWVIIVCLAALTTFSVRLAWKRMV